MNAAAVLDQLSIVADALRARTLAVLARQELTVSELCDVLQLPQSTVSRHLKTLSDGGWVVSRREGTSRYYSLSLDELDASHRRLWQLIAEQVGETAEAVQDEARLKSVLAERRTKSEEFFSSAAGQWDRMRDELFGRDSHLRPLLGLLDDEAGGRRPGLRHGAGERRARAVCRAGRRGGQLDRNAAGRARARPRRCEHRRSAAARSSACRSRTARWTPRCWSSCCTTRPNRRACCRRLRGLSSRAAACSSRTCCRTITTSTGRRWDTCGSGSRSGRWNAGARARGSTRFRWHPLPAEAGVKGPALFVATGSRGLKA